LWSVGEKLKTPSVPTKLVAFSVPSRIVAGSAPLVRKAAVMSLIASQAWPPK